MQIVAADSNNPAADASAPPGPAERWRPARRGSAGQTPAWCSLLLPLLCTAVALAACGSDACEPGARVRCDCVGVEEHVTCDGNGDIPPCLCSKGSGAGGGKSGGFSWDGKGLTVTDIKGGLQWQRLPAPDAYTWEPAKAYCDALSLDGFDDWLLPHKDELLTIVLTTTSAPSIDTKAFPSTPAKPFWTRTLYAPLQDTHAWGVDFEDGGEGYAAFVEPHFVRCVRAVGSP